MTSLRLVAAALGISGDFSVMHDLMGFNGTKVPQMPGIAPATISLRDHIQALRGRRIDIIWAHLRTLTQAEEDLEDAAIHFTRAVYGTVGITVGRVQPGVAPGVSPSFLVLDSESEYESLIEQFSGPQGPIDMFLVDSFNFKNEDGSNRTTFGISPTDGDCDKQDQCGDDGLAVAFTAQSHGSPGTPGEQFGKVAAHELGHFLALEHLCGDAGECAPGCGTTFNDNLMVQGSCQDTMVRVVSLLQGQGQIMREHCSVHLPLIPF